MLQWVAESWDNLWDVENLDLFAYVNLYIISTHIHIHIISYSYMYVYNILYINIYFTRTKVFPARWFRTKQFISLCGSPLCFGWRKGVGKHKRKNMEKLLSWRCIHINSICVYILEHVHSHLYKQVWYPDAFWGMAVNKRFMIPIEFIWAIPGNIEWDWTLNNGDN